MLAAKQLHLQPSEIDGKEQTTITARERTGIVAWVRRRIDWLEDPTPVYERSKTETEGLSRNEWHEWLSLHSSHENFKEELREREQRKAED